MRAIWLAEVLRAAGLPVVEHPGWKERGEGEFIELESVVWHHDASAVGYSPGMADYIRSQVDLHKPGANCWVTLDGTWHLIAAEVTYHAGTVLPGKAGNHRAIGIETDHTTGETWSGVHLLDSLRRGTAAILCRLGTTTGGLEFHKTICSPPGRKTDPDGLVLAVERGAVSALLHPTTGDDVYEYRIVTIPPVNDRGTQIVGHDVNGKALGVFANDVVVSLKANDDSRPVRAFVEPYGYQGNLALSFLGLDGEAAPEGNVGVIIGHPPR